MWKITELSKYARLADTVDRLDPLVREMKAAKSYRLLVLWYGGYPNDYLLTLYRQQGVRFWRVRWGMHWLARLLIWFLHIMSPGRTQGEDRGRYLHSSTDYWTFDRTMAQYPTALVCPKPDPMGWFDPEKPYLCIGVRDMAYYQFYGSPRERTAHRCPTQDTYQQVALNWAQRGWQVVRMGLRVSEPWPSLHSNIFDYASSRYRTDEQDIKLLAHCEFCLAGDTGLYSAAAAFDRPCVVSDLFLIRKTVYSSNKRTPNLYLPVLFRDASGRILPLSEALRRHHEFCHRDECQQHGITIVHNTAEEILAATNELYNRAHGEWQETEEDRDLQLEASTVHSKFTYSKPLGVGLRYHVRQSTGKIPASYLRAHPELRC